MKDAWKAAIDLWSFGLVEVAGAQITVGSLMLALLFVIGLWGVARFFRRILQRFEKRHPNVNQGAMRNVLRLANYAFVAVGVLVGLDVLGVPLSHLAVFTGAIGVGLGFGLKEIFNNFIAGLILLFDGSLKNGDFIELDSDVRGTVRAVNIRFTCVTTNDGIDVLVPNSDFITNRVINWTHDAPTRRLTIPFGVAYGVDKEDVQKAALEAAERVPHTVADVPDHKPALWLTGFGDSAMNYELVVWVDEQGTRNHRATLAAYRWEIDSSLKSHGLEIPYPQRDIRIRSAFGLEGPEAMRLLRPAE